MQIQDWENIGRRELLGGQGVCTHRYRKILCGESYQQEDDGGQGTYGTGQIIEPWTGGLSKLIAAVIGSERDRSFEESINGPSKYIDASGLLRDHEQLSVSPGCFRSIDSGIITYNPTVYLVTDLALGGELFDRICRKGSYYESDAADLIRATLSAVAYLHDHGIVHRDLKPENLLFRTPEDNADLLIADFGLSRIMDEEAFHVLTTTCGTPGYMAPEIFKKTGHGKPVFVLLLIFILLILMFSLETFGQ